MAIGSDNIKPIYIQIAEWLENQILSGRIKTDEKIYSQYQLAEMYTINPATAAKGLSILLDKNIVYKKRGLGMFVSSDAHEIIFEKRKSLTLRKLALELISEADRLNVSEKEIIALLNEVKIEIEEGNK